MKFLYVLLLLLVLATNTPVHAHAGGHGHEANSALKEWSFTQPHEKLTASFSSLNNGTLALEDAQGHIIRFSLTDLTEADQRFVLAKYGAIKTLNGLAAPEAAGALFSFPLLKPAVWQIGLIGLFFTALYFVWKRRGRYVAVPLLLVPLCGVLIGLKSTVPAFLSTDPAFIDGAFTPFKPDVATSWDDTYFYVESLGIPDHEMMVGITNWQQQVPVPQCYTGNNAWSIPLNPVEAATPVPTASNFFRGAIALATNGVPIFNSLNNRGEDAFLIGELDEFGGHCGRADDYHYHTAPLSLEDATNAVLPIAFALDGFAVYGSKEPDGSDMETLDANNGHYGNEGVYHYHGTTTYPYLIGNMVGEVTIANEQIEPQAASATIRPAGEPLNGAVITSHRATGDMGYTMTYTLNDATYTLNYGWTANGQYNFELTNPDGSTDSDSYNAFLPCAIACEDNAYSGSASVTQGLANTITENIYSCQGGRLAGIGSITASDNTVITVPAENNYQNTDFPFASDLYNSCTGVTNTSAAQALAALDGSDIVEIDADGEVITGYIFADNYFELYINGVAVGKDNVPFTQFNSDLVRFRVNRPFTIAMKLIDWEENLGIGTESNQGFSNHAGDGGMVAVFKDAANATIATTGSEWKTQTFYTAPVKDLCCVSEEGTLRLSDECNSDATNDGSAYYGLHWEIPADWTSETFDDSSWPAATTYTNNTIGVDNKPAYTNFTDIFDDAADDAEFIWSTNVVLDNEVIARYTVETSTSTHEIGSSSIRIFPNPVSSLLTVEIGGQLDYEISIYSMTGRLMHRQRNQNSVDVQEFANGTYLLELTDLATGQRLVEKILVSK